jgi:RecA-family ATPase
VSQVDHAKPEGKSHEPLLNADTDTVPEEWLNQPPPERKFLLDGVLPCGKVGLYVAPGGTGKGWTLLQLAVGVATGRPVLGRWEVPEPGSVLLLAGEDEPDELRRRLWTIYQALAAEAAGRDIKRALRQRLYLHSVVGQDPMLTTVDNNGNVQRTEFAARLLATALEIPDLKLIVLDPLSRFRGGEENDSKLATAFVVTLEHIVQETGATVLTAHHTNKGSQGNDGSMAHGAARGSSALTDGVRWQANLATMTTKEAKDYGIEPNERRRYVRLEVPKNNYAPPIEGMWLQRQHGGYLLAVDLEPSPTAGRTHPDETHLPAVVRLVRDRLVAGEEYSPRQFEDRFGGKDGQLGISQKQLRRVLNLALEQGKIIKRPARKSLRKNRKVLDLPPTQQEAA